jgi:hypothetical protein
MKRRPSRLRILLKVLLSGLVLSGAALAARPASSPAQGTDSVATAPPPQAPPPQAAAPQTPAPAERVAALKESILKDRAALKKEEISDYMKKAAEAIKSYVPPDPEKIQAAKEAGRVSINMLDPGKRARLDFRDYNIPGDNLGVEIDLVTNKLLGMQVTTMVEGGKEPVTFQVQYAALEDGIGYPAKTTLDAQEMNVTIVVENSGYKKKTTP